MGSSSSWLEKTPVEEHPGIYRCDIIDDESINYVIHINSQRLTSDERATAREAQILATHELNSTMKNCELVMYLDNTTIKMRAGNCDNRIKMQKSYTGEIKWDFTRSSFKQTVYSGVKTVGPRLHGFFSAAVPIAGKVVKKIGWL